MCERIDKHFVKLAFQALEGARRCPKTGLQLCNINRDLCRIQPRQT